MLIPDAAAHKYLDNLIGGLSMFLAGPDGLSWRSTAFVVLVGMLILSGAVNTRWWARTAYSTAWLRMAC